MRIKKPHIYTALGWSPTGDLGPYTFYTSADRGIVFFPRSPPKVPATRKQRYRRDQFRFAALAWKSLPDNARRKWNKAASRANLRISGYNLWTYLATTGDVHTILTICAQTKISLLDT